MFLWNTQNNEKALLRGSHYGAWDLLTPPRHSGMGLLQESIERPFFRAVAHVPYGHPETGKRELFEAEAQRTQKLTSTSLSCPANVQPMDFIKLFCLTPCFLCDLCVSAVEVVQN
jgi:hypothetical protein